LWTKAHATGAQLLWRVKCKNVYHPVADLPDGSQLAVMATRGCQVFCVSRRGDL